MLDVRVYRSAERETIMADFSEYRNLLSVHTDVNNLNDFLHRENARLREAIKSAMNEIANDDYAETYHILYAALAPSFSRLDVHVGKDI